MPTKGLKCKECRACGQGFDEDNCPVGNCVPTIRCANGLHEGPIERLPGIGDPGEMIQPANKNAVFVLGICQNVNSVDMHIFDLAGTTFAVGRRRLLGAYHCLFNDDVGSTTDQLTSALNGFSVYIGTSATRAANPTNRDEGFCFEMQEAVRVSVIAGSYLQDWLVMECGEDLPSYLTLCPPESLPDVEFASSSIRVVHCPVGKFVVDKLSGKLRPQILRTTIVEISEQSLETPNGLVTGSSGGVYIDAMGRAVAIHLECNDELKSRSTSADSTTNAQTEATQKVGMTTRTVRFELELKAVREEMVRMKASLARSNRYIKQLGKKHMSFGRGLIISTTVELMAALTKED